MLSNTGDMFWSNNYTVNVLAKISQIQNWIAGNRGEIRRYSSEGFFGNKFYTQRLQHQKSNLWEKNLNYLNGVTT